MALSVVVFSAFYHRHRHLLIVLLSLEYLDCFCVISECKNDLFPSQDQKISRREEGEAKQGEEEEEEAKQGEEEEEEEEEEEKDEEKEEEHDRGFRRDTNTQEILSSLLMFCFFALCVLCLCC